MENIVLGDMESQRKKQLSGIDNLDSSRESPVLVVSSPAMIRSSTWWEVGIIFLDISKAFDTVPHSILLDKLSTCEISRFILHWLNRKSLEGCSEWGYI